MRRWLLPRIALLFALWAAFGDTARGQTRSTPADLDAPLRAFWDAASPDEAERAVPRVLGASSDFDAIWKRLKAGRTYTTHRTARAPERRAGSRPGRSGLAPEVSGMSREAREAPDAD